MKAALDGPRRALQGALLPALLACAPLGCSRGPEATPLLANRPYVGELFLEDTGEAFFRLELPEDCVALAIELECAAADLELDLELGPQLPRSGGEAELSAVCDAGRARIELDRFSEPPLEGRVCSLRVAWESRSRPRGTGRELADLSYTLRARVHRSRQDGELLEGAVLEGSLGRECGGFRCYRIQVPPTAEVLRVDILDTDGDLDLLASPGSPALRFGPEVASAQFPYGRETLLLRREGPFGLRPGPWWIEVVDPHDSERDEGFRLRASFDERPQPDQLLVPDLARFVREHEDQPFLAAVVELETAHGVGSGTLIGPEGWILTNAHVVEGRESMAEQVVVSVTLDATRPPVESFRASVELVDARADLALLRVRTGFQGQELPEGYRFPCVPLASGTWPNLGDSVRVVGYPLTGGQGTRVSISLTRGIVSGFDRSPEGLLIKTDAEITNGNSGGAALSDTGCLLGIPSSTVENGSGQIGYIHPVLSLPEEWLRAAGARVCR